ncbi:MAG TPA: VOC family protein [Gemmatimonadales bacterium]
MPALTRSAPYFPVTDVLDMVDHYEKVFGFRREYVGGEPPEFAIVSRDGLPIMLRRVGNAADIRPNAAQGGAWDVFFWVRDLDALATELVDAGATLVYAPVVQEAYGMKEFAVRDPAGYVLGFGENLGKGGED